jgi:hypothetical protein
MGIFGGTFTLQQPEKMDVVVGLVERKTSDNAMATKNFRKEGLAYIKNHQKHVYKMSFIKNAI